MKESVHCCRLVFFWHLLTSARPRIGLPLLRSTSGCDCFLISLPASLSPRSQTKSASPRSPPRQTETRWTWRPSASSPRSSLLPSPVSSTLPKNCPCSPRWVEVNGFSGSELGVRQMHTHGRAADELLSGSRFRKCVISLSDWGGAQRHVTQELGSIFTTRQQSLFIDSKMQ